MGRPDLRGRILVRNGVFINSRRNSLQSSIEILREGFINCQAAGDYSYAVYGALEIAWLTFESGAPLDQLGMAALKYAAFAQQSRNVGLLETLRAQEAFVACMAGKTSVADFFARGADSLGTLTSARFGTGIAYFHLMGQWVALMNGDYRLALDKNRQVADSLKSITGWVAETSYHFLAVLTLAALDSPDFRAEQGDWQGQLTGHMTLLRVRAEDSPNNYRSRYLLAAAEVARISDQPLEAQGLYEDAIRSAHENGFGHLEALAYDLASHFYRGRGLDLIADTYLHKARDGFVRWGARFKVHRIEALAPANIGGGEAHAPSHDLDAISVVKASQAVSGEIALDRLIETLLRITVENAGADRGVLVVDLDGALTVVADARMGEGAVTVETLRRKPGGYALAAKVLNYVQHARTRVLLDDAGQDRDFGADKYLSRGDVKSLLCLPMIKQSRLIGMLYLENSQVSHAFTAGRIALLELLSSQAAISLENALLYEDLQRHRDDLERTVALRTAELVEKKYQLDKILAEQDIILENASLGIVVVVPSDDGRRLIRRANRAAERLFGFGTGEMVGHETRVVWPSEEVFKSMASAYRVLASGRTYSGEHAIRRGPRDEGFARVVGSAVDPTDLSKGTVWLVEDITERRAAALALEEANELFRHKSEQVASLLDNSGQGFLSFGTDLVVDPEYSRACQTMLGRAPAGENIAALLFPHDPQAAELLRAGVTMGLAEEDRDRQAMIISLLPAEIQRDRLILRAEYSVLDTGRIMLVLTDITEERRLAERINAEHRRLQMVVAAVTESRDFFDTIVAFREFLGQELPALVGSGMPVKELLGLVYRRIHTFKGTLDQFSFQHTPDELHALEGHLSEMRARVETLSAADISACLAAAHLDQHLDKDMAALSEIIGADFLDMGERVTLSANQAVQLEKLASSLLRGETIDWAATEIRQLLLEIGYLRKVPLRDVLAGYGRTANQIALRLEKELAPVEIIDDSDLWINPTTFGPFIRSLVHVFRNAVAHGIEDADTRLAAGKDQRGRITCRIRDRDGQMELTIADDGAGIDVAAVLVRATEKGLISPQMAAELSEEQILDMIFLDSLTTTALARQFSGRGVGLAAVRAEVQKLGGAVRVTSELGRGTSFIFTLPHIEERKVCAA
ncbi:MAG: GAF domain-containing protein [Magnetospirillum sp.]|nr:GAF domain-containing protein [Magnetospirillum sp.]